MMSFPASYKAWVVCLCPAKVIFSISCENKGQWIPYPPTTNQIRQNHKKAQFNASVWIRSLPLNDTRSPSESETDIFSVNCMPLMVIDIRNNQSFSQYDCIKSIKFEPVLEMTRVKTALCPHKNYSVNAALSGTNVISHQNDGMKEFESQW